MTFPISVVMLIIVPLTGAVLASLVAEAVLHIIRRFIASRPASYASQ